MRWNKNKTKKQWEMPRRHKSVSFDLPVSPKHTYIGIPEENKAIFRMQILRIIACEYQFVGASSKYDLLQPEYVIPGAFIGPYLILEDKVRSGAN